MVLFVPLAFCRAFQRGAFALAALAFLVLALTTRSARADGEFKAWADAKTVGVGQPFQVTLQAMASGAAPSEPSPGSTAGFDISAPSVQTQTQISIMNGQRTDSVGITATWTLAARKVGTFHLAPSAVVNGSRRAANAITITVVPTGQAPPRQQSQDPFAGLFGGGGQSFSPLDPFKGIFPGFNDPRFDSQPQTQIETDPRYALDATRGAHVFLHATLDKTSAVVGEQVTLTIYLYVDAMESDHEITDVHEAPAADFVRKSLVENESEARQVGNAIIAGRVWGVKLVRKIAFFPLKTGDLEIGGMTLALSRGPGAGARRESEVLHLRVSEPPVAGRPPGYAIGDVGQFALAATVEPRVVERGGAIGVNVDLSGTGNLPSSLPMPVLAGVQWLDPQTHEKLGATKSDRFGGTRSFAYVVRFEKEGDVDLGDLTLPFWDPDAHAYRVAHASLGTVRVTPGTTPAPSSDAPGDPLPNLPSARAALEGLPPARAHAIDSPLFWLSLVFAPFAFVFTITARAAAGSIKKRNTEKRTSPAAELRLRIQAAETAARQLDVRAADAAILRAIETATTVFAAVNVRAETSERVVTRLTDGGVDEELARALADLYRECETARFSPETPPVEEMRARWKRALDVIAALKASGTFAKRDAKNDSLVPPDDENGSPGDRKSVQ